MVAKSQEPGPTQLLNHILALICSISLGVVGQILLKFAALRANTGADADASTGVISLFLRPATIVGLGVYFFAALLYLFALKRVPLSVAYPSVSASYILVTLLAHFIWQEPLGLRQAVALGLISCGVILLIRPS